MPLVRGPMSQAQTLPPQPIPIDFIMFFRILCILPTN